MPISEIKTNWETCGVQIMNAGPYWGVGLFGKYTMTSGDKDTTIAENIFKDYLKRFDCGIGWNRY